MEVVDMRSKRHINTSIIAISTLGAAGRRNGARLSMPRVAIAVKGAGSRDPRQLRYRSIEPRPFRGSDSDPKSQNLLTSRPVPGDTLNRGRACCDPDRG